MRRSRPRPSPLLYALAVPIADELDAYDRAVVIATETGQHVCDTLHHAVALADADTVLVTADRGYLRAAQRFGQITDLRTLALA